MAKYNYKCLSCNTSVDIEKPMKDASREEKCECGEVLTRMFAPTCAVWKCSGSYAGSK